MGRVRITRPIVLLALVALLAPCAEASRTSVWESNPPASLKATKTDAAGLLASLAPAAAADSEAEEPPVFNLGDIVLVDTANADAENFGLGPLTLVDLNLLRGPPPSYPETRVRGFELLPPFRIGASPTLSLWPRRACGSISCGLASDGPEDPWGLCGKRGEPPCGFEPATPGEVFDFATGAGHAVATNALGGTGRQAPYNRPNAIGQAVGDAASAIWGGIETIFGGGVELGGMALDATGVGALVGVPANIAGGVVMSHGVVMGTAALKNLTNGKSASGGAGDSKPPRAKSRREDYMGRTPGKKSKTGREVIDRMKNEGTARDGPGGTVEVKDKDGNWVPAEATDMSHLDDAVKYWNREGYKTGKKSPEVRRFMKDPGNYELEPSGSNRSRGAKLGEKYRPPEPGDSTPDITP